MRGERGQTGAEYLGALLLVSVVTAAVATSSAGATIAEHAKTLVCRIAGGDCAAPPSAIPTPAPTPAPTPVGPALNVDIGFPVLPFPSSVAVTCSMDSRPDEKLCSSRDAAAGKYAQVDVEVELERTPTKLDANGCPVQTSSVSATFREGVGRDRKSTKNPKNELAVNAYAGQKIKYEITTSPDQMDAIADDERPAPNPVDPTTIQPGESVQLSEEYYAGLGAEGVYDHLVVSMGYEKGRRVSAAVTRLPDKKTVRVTVGDADFVRNSLTVGVGNADVNVGVGNTKDLSDGKLYTVDIDISTEAGWNAYQTFLRTGQLPQDGTPGTSNPTSAETVVYTDATKAEANLWNVKIGGQLGDSEGQKTWTTNADGSVDTVMTARVNDTSITTKTSVDANGDPVGTPTYSLMLEDVDPAMADTLAQLTGAPPQGSGTNVRLDFTEAQLNEVQGLAQSAIADQIEQSTGKRPTNAEVAAGMDNGVLTIDGVQYAFPYKLMALASAKTPAEILIALYQGGFGADAVLGNLVDLLAPRGIQPFPIFAQPDC